MLYFTQSVVFLPINSLQIGILPYDDPLSKVLLDFISIYIDMEFFLEGKGTLESSAT